jgi:NAD(P)-dependent dehydrogenase (short-subunit alcohol dehydrogenase family)
MIAELFGLEGRVAVVTGAGAGGGIGHAIALGLARAGARLAVCDIDATGLARTLDELAACSQSPLGRLADVADAGQVEAFFAAVDRAMGRIDVLVNVPFWFRDRVKPHRLSEAAWERTLEVSLKGYFLPIRACLPRMLAQGGGSIINIGSNAGVSALGRGACAYSCAKAAVHQLTREVALEYAARGIRCNAIVPAQVLTPGLKAHLENPDFQREVLPRILGGLPMGRLLEPDDLVGAAVFLAADASRMVTGILLAVDGGNTAMNAGGGALPFTDQ